MPLIAVSIAAGCSSSSLPAVPGADEVDGGVPAVVPGDAGAAGCDLVLQDCPDGEKCTIIRGAERAIGCVSVAGTRAVGQSCDVAAGIGDDCAPGLYCDASSSPAVCVALCRAEPADSCGPDGVCALTLATAEGEARLCAQACDPVLQDCERNEFACYPSRSGSTCAQIGGGGAAVAEGGACGFANECSPGLACLRVGQSWSCFKVCDPFDLYATDCSAAQLCNRVDDESWGICITE